MKLLNLVIPSIVAGALLAGCQKTTPSTPNRKPPVVKAGTAQTITLPNDSVVVTGVVTDSGSKVVAYLWSEVSGPNVPVIADEGSLSTKITGFTAGTYLFQLMATDTFGLTGVDTVRITVNPAASVTIIGGSSNFTALSYLGPSPDETTGGSPEMGAEAWTINGVVVFVHDAFKFDFSTLLNQPIKSAKLTLYSNPTPFTGNLSTPNYGTSNAFWIQRAATAWTTTGATWNTQPQIDTTGQVLIPQTNASSLDLIDIDVTTMVRNMVANGNYGFFIHLQNEVIYNSRIFCGGLYSDATKHPKLVINY